MKAADIKVGMVVKIRGVRCATNGRIAARGPIMQLLPNGCVVDCGFNRYHVNANQVSVVNEPEWKPEEVL